ncbi:conserved hypothetical protein [Leishmania infantum JPCM5]|uniref:Uncharacterized protein n=2 Tax=Leishmania infantum TaxID=5671 RepID=A4I8E9_LEIIN|nr:conserved hypothetical protein [Leishmania infantum JPCM5]CAC9527718.1 hypothetical_protein_-_conserved [Leishmania infantum]CAM71092.1 conserved hypothetical protein [Leishmania infantum JPCM5]SUZ44915.1 hypothetical_protein_-_conserved [Leishmania infantum]|eukprot:XP_001468018.1 conserved hypothetical protein [Leishmania infantum JPCM5]
MPRIQLQSVNHFSAWLQNEILTEVPFGLSLRLRPLTMQASTAVSGDGFVLARPHVGHLIASLTAETSRLPAALATDDGGAAEAVEQEAAEVSRSLSGRVPSTIDWYAFFLKTLLHLTSTNGSHLRCTGASSSPSSPTCVVAATDGVGRKTALYAAMLSHCAEWWDAGRAMRSTSALLWHHSPPMQRAVSLRRPFVFFDETSEAAGRLADPSRLSGRDSADVGARRRLLRVLRLLSARGGWQLCVRRSPRGGAARAVSTTSSTLLHQEDEESVYVDWLDYLTERCVEVDLRPAGDYDDFESLLRGTASHVWLGSSSTAHSTPITTSSARTRSCGCAGGGNTGFACAVPDAFVPLSAVLWHVLSTEVEGTVLETLHGLLRQYLCWPFLAPPDRAGDPLTTRRGDVTSILGYAYHALQTLVHTPEQAFACELMHFDRNGAASSTASALPPPLAGPVTLSCMMPNSFCLAPLACDSAASRFFLQGPPASVAPDGMVLRRHPLRVLLLRVDPEGGWLPSPETLASQRTLHASFDAQRGEACDGDEGCEDDDNEMDDDFALWEARGAGKRTVARPGAVAPGQRTAVTSLPSPSLCADRSPTEDRVVSMLTAHVIRRGPFAQAVTSARNLDQYLWLAAIRLFVYALLHDVRVVVTPERLPTFVKVFGYRHLPQLHQRLCEVRGALREAAADDGTLLFFEDADDAVTRAAAVSLLDAACQREPPIAVYVVDQVSLSGFSRLQARSRASETTSADRVVPSAPSSLPLPPVVLCCDVLRHPCSFDEACGSSRPSGICEVAHCGVLDVIELCHISALLLQSQHSPCSAEKFAVRCAAVVASEEGGESRLYDGRVFIAALHPIVTPSLTDADDRFRTQTGERGADPRARCGADADAWNAAVDESELWQPLLPSLLLLAPIQQQTMLYGGLLRKAALALLEALPSPCTSETDISTSMRDTTRTARTSIPGAVRGGGAFFVSLARQARWLMRRLSLSPACADAAATLAGVGVAGSRPFASPEAVSWGIGVAPQDHATIRFVLAILCESCAAMVTRLAEPLIERSAASGLALSPLCSARTSPPPRGPHARRRLWVEALRAAVESSSTVPGQPVLHAYHENVDVMLSEAANGTVFDACLGAPTLHERAMQWFASDRRLSSSTSQSGANDDACVHRGGCATEPPLPTHLFLEPLHTNARAVREAVALVLRTLSATVP